MGIRFSQPGARTTKVLKLPVAGGPTALSPLVLFSLLETTFSIEAWVCLDASAPTGAGSLQPLFTAPDTATGTGLRIGVESQMVCLSIGGQNLYGATRLQAGVFYHVMWLVATPDLANAGCAAYVYVNGILDGAAGLPRLTLAVVPSRTLHFAGYVPSATSVTSFSGRIAELRVKAPMQSASTQKDLYRRVAGDPPLLYCRFDDEAAITGTSANLPAVASGSIGLTEFPPILVSRNAYGGSGSSVFCFTQLPTSGGTYAMWVRTTSTSCAIFNLQSRTRTVLIDLVLTAGQPTVRVAGSAVVSHTTSIADGLWHYVAVVLGKSAVSVYVDLTAVSAPFSGLPTQPAWLIEFGRTQPLLGAFAGFIEEVQVSNTERGAPSLLERMRKSYDPSGSLPADLAAYFSFLSLAGGQGNAYALSLGGLSQGAIQKSPLTAPINFAPAMRITAPGGVLQFPGTTTDLLPAATEFTFEFWINYTSSASYPCCWSMRYEDGGSAIDITCQPILLLQDARSSLPLGINLADGQWHHIALTCKIRDTANLCTLYLDGKAVSPVDFSRLRTGPRVRSTLRFSLQNAPATGVTVDISDVRVWALARTAEEIQSTRTRAPNDHYDFGFVAVWPLFETGPGAIRLYGGRCYPNGLTATPVPDPLTTFPALRFDGAGSHLRVLNSGGIEFPMGSDFSIALNLQLAEAQAAGATEVVIAEKRAASGDRRHFSLRFLPATGVLQFSRGGVTLTTQSSFKDTLWHRVVITGSATEYVLNVDNVVQARAALGGTLSLPDRAAEIYLGAAAPLAGQTAGQLPFKGALRGLALSIGGRQIALWALESLSPARRSSVEADVPLLGSSTAPIAETALPLTDVVPGTTLIPVLDFDGLSSYVEVQLPASTPAVSALTVEAWVRYPAASAGVLPNPLDGVPPGPILSAGGPGGGWELACADYGLTFSVWDVGAWELALPGQAQPDVLFHVAVVYTLAAANTPQSPPQIFINGVLQGALHTLSAHPAAAPTSRAAPIPVVPLCIGTDATSQTRFFQGQLAEVRVWSRARGQSEIARDLFSRLSGSEPGLLAYLPLTDGEGTIAGAPGALPPGNIVGATWLALDAHNRLPRIDSPAPLLTPQALAQQRHATLFADFTQAVADTEALRTRAAILEQDIAAQQAALALRLRQLDEEAAPARIALEQHVTALKARAARLKAAGVDAFLEDLVLDVRDQLDSGRTDSDAGHRLEKVSVDLRFLAGNGGAGANFPPPSSNIDAALLSTLTVELDPKAPPPPPSSEVEIPDVRGYTGALARGFLRSVGLLSELHEQVVVQAEQAARVLTQHPAPGARATRGSTVLLFVGKATDIGAR